jgi:hypothetical protein
MTPSISVDAWSLHLKLKFDLALFQGPSGLLPVRPLVRVCSLATEVASRPSGSPGDSDLESESVAGVRLSLELSSGCGIRAITGVIRML